MAVLRQKTQNGTSSHPLSKRKQGEGEAEATSFQGNVRIWWEGGGGTVREEVCALVVILKVESEERNRANSIPDGRHWS